MNIRDSHPFVLVSGANGYIGPYVVKSLIEKGYGVIGCCWHHPRSTLLIHSRIINLKLDLGQEESIPWLLEKTSEYPIKAVVHLAALLGHPDEEKNYHCNVKTTQNLISFCHQRNIRRFVYLSSIAAKKKNKGPYGRTKLEGEKKTMESSLDYTIYLPEMVIGRESLGFNRILKNIHRFPAIVPLIGPGTTLRHPIYIHDLVETITIHLFDPRTYRKKYELACGTQLPFRELLRRILSFYGKRKIFIPIPVFLCLILGKIFERTFTIPPFSHEHILSLTEDTLLDIEKAQKEIDFHPTPLGEFLPRVIQQIGPNYHQHLKPRQEIEIPCDEFQQ